LAGFTGLSKSEIQGLECPDYTGEQVSVNSSWWQGHRQPPKTKKRKAPVPVIEPLARKIDSYRLSIGNLTSGPMFPSDVYRGKPRDLNNLARRVIRPALERAGIDWYGWHAFRRGLGTNLNRLGVNGKTIQAILRHSDIGTTMNNYVKAIPEDSQKAMRQLEAVCTSMHLGQDSEKFVT
jgi:integrase